MDLAAKCLAIAVVLQIAISSNGVMGVEPSETKMSRSLVAVQGVVYCKSCKYAGVDTLLDASPLQGATVGLACNNTEKGLTMESKTDKNGYFLMLVPKKITSYAFHKCRATLVKSAENSCKIPSQLNNGTTGGFLRPSQPITVGKVSYVLYTVGPFAFDPSCPR
ncbi:PREDICTED: non-classical arabinogalactan protein 31 [Tarenaya hassleriana]|uniref:non-classical arabinogalactan protein 31 n=1 Tax=Tarenaya hassleriana TaxID=28532 RepID=UPI00053C1B31|nr:PREDICTED: non-classical arabinogalactan protein 31 [Tarenaya hassleriana]